MKILWGLIILYIIVFGIFVSFRHYNFQTQAWDMGIFTQTFWNTAEGRIMQNTIEEVPNHLAVHMSPGLFVLVPGFILFPSPYYLLIIQTLALALGAWPLYLLAKRVLNDERLSLLIAIGYLLYPALHWINIFDFHAVSFLVPLLITALYFIEAGGVGWATLFLVLAASTREDAILAVFAVGIFILLRKRFVFGSAVVAASLIYFIISVQFIMPALGGGLLRLDRYAELGVNPSLPLLIQTVFNADKMFYLFWLFLPVLFLPLLSWRALILLVPGLAENLLTTFTSQFSGQYQYDAMLVAGIFIATVYGLKNFLERWPDKKRLVFWFLALATITGFFFRSPLNPIFFPTELFKTNPHWENFREMVRVVPDNISVSAHTNLVPHLALRDKIYLLGTEPEPADIVLLDTADAFGFLDTASFQSYIDDYYNSKNYNIKITSDRYVIFTKKSLAETE